MTTLFNPTERLAALGLRAEKAVGLARGDNPLTPSALYAAAAQLRDKHPRLAKRLHDLGAVWAVNHKGVRA